MITLLLLAALGCATETGNPELDVRLSVSGTSSEERVAVDNHADIFVEGAYAIIDDVRLVQGDACDAPGEVEYEAEGPFAADLLAPDPLVVHIPAVTDDYCRLRVRLDRADGTPDGFPAGMDDHALYIAGERADGVPFVIRSREKFEVDLRSEGEPFPIEQGRDQLVLAFDLGTWLRELDLEAADPGSDGTIRVDEDSNEGLLERFEEGVEEHLELYEDGDGDGAVGPGDEMLAD